MSGSPLIIIAFDPAARGGRMDDGIPAIPVALLYEVFAERVVERSIADGRHCWLIRNPDDVQARDSELSFDAQDGLASVVTLDEVFFDDWLHRGIFRVLRETPSLLISEGSRPAIAQAVLAPHLPKDFIRDFGPAFVLGSPDDLGVLPDAMPERRRPEPASRSAFISYARSRQAQTQYRHRFHNVATVLRARLVAAATPGEPRGEALVAALSRIIAATWPPDGRDWMQRVSEAMAEVDMSGAPAVEGCGDGMMTSPLGTLAADWARLQAEEESLDRMLTARPWASGATLQIGPDEIGALLSRLSYDLAWRLGDHERSFDDDLYMTVPGDRMFEVHRIEHPPTDVGSLHDDMAELRKLIAEPDRPVTPVDVERMGHVLLAIAARM